MKKIIVLLAALAGIWFWQNGGGGNDIGFDKAGHPVVVIFTVANCGSCQDALDILSERGVPFEERLIDPGNEGDTNVRLWRRGGNNIFPLTVSGNRTFAGSSRWELISLLGDNFGGRYLLDDEQYYFSRHFDANGKPRIVLYGTDWCPGCAALRKAFYEQGDEYVDIDVERSGEFKRMTEVMEINGYPAVWVGYKRVHGSTYDAVMSVAKTVI